MCVLAQCVAAMIGGTQLMLPMLKGEPMGTCEIPDSLTSDDITLEAVLLEVIQLCDLQLQNNVFTSSMLEALVHKLKNVVHENYKYSLYEPMIKLCYRVMHMDYPGYSKWYLLGQEVATMRVHYFGQLHENKCCERPVFELLAHCTPDLIEEMPLPNQYNDGYSIFRLLSQQFECLRLCPQIVSCISHIMQIIWMYNPTLTVHVADLLKKERKNFSDNVILKAFDEMEAQLQQVRPLVLLTRLRILKHIQWKDVHKLPLPKQLKNYVKVGDIPDDHIFHTLI